ncbi:MAG TPA: ATP-binding cassette domain-containing protein [Rectinemataceae bacterium]|nr:ATP-binding cassette domain-containing protein [Rectinemataceae bacterium]
MIEAKELRKSYNRVEAVKGVSFSVERGQVVGLLGPNGAGKTTIMKILTGYHFPSEGSALIDGVDVTEDPVAIKRKIGYLPESAPLYPDQSPAEYLDFVAEARGLVGAARRQAIDKAVAACSLGPVFNKPVEELSKGYRQRLGLAQAILHDPDILILDEPTSGLDPNQILEIRALIRELGKEKTVILSTHILQEVEAVCSKVLILNEGRIAAQGTAEEIGEALKGEARVSFRLRPRKEGIGAKDIESALKRLPSIGALRSLEAAQGSSFAVEIALQAGQAEADSGALVFEWAVSEGLVLLELVPRKLSLEEIFVKLTTEGGKE